MGKLSRDKGASFERRLAKRWRDLGLFPDAVRRGEGQAKRDDRRKPADVEGVPFRVEAKDRKAHNLRRALEQCEDTDDWRPAVVVAHYHGDPMDRSLVVMRLADWERLVGDGP